jgi:peptidoglycan hydrolase CwlO-like protein
MKKIFLLTFIAVLTFSSNLFSQSDYRVTQEFKSRQRSFEIAIEYAKSLSELEKIKREILEFKSEYRGSKELLDRALYPNTFHSSFVSLEKKITYTTKKLSEITTLSQHVSQLESDYAEVTKQLQRLTNEVNILRKSNSRLMTQLKAFKNNYGGSKQTIDSLNNLITELKQGISQRDTLIKEIMDNIFVDNTKRIENLDSKELKGLKGQIQNTSLIENIRSLVDDNVKFLKTNLLRPKDFKDLRNEFNDLDSRWEHFGPKLFEIYARDESQRSKLTEIDSLIKGWDKTLNTAVWNSINELFKVHKIDLEQFSTGEEFEKSCINFINKEINNSDTHRKIAKEQTYLFFAERVWNDQIKKDWLPILFENNMLTEYQVKNIDSKIAEWKSNIGNSKSILIYGVIVVVALLIIGSLIFLSIRNKNRVEKIANKNEDQLDDLTDEQKDNVDDLE